MKVLLVRHGDAVNSDHKFHGLENKPLSKEGRKQVEDSIDELKQHDPKMIFTDNLPRTRESASILSGGLDIPVHQTDAVQPLDLGDFVGKDMSDGNREAVRQYLDNPDKQIPGGGTVNEWAKKYLPFLESHVKDESKDTVIHMTHGRNIVLAKAWQKAGSKGTNFDKKALVDNKESTEHGGYAVIDHGNKPIKIMTPKSVPAGQS